MSASCLEPINSVLATNALINDATAVVPFEVEACYDICRRCLAIERPSYSNLNRVIAQVISSLTIHARSFRAYPNVDVNSLLNILPINSLHFFTASYAPFAPIGSSLTTARTMERLIFGCWEPYSMMVKCDPFKGKYMGCYFILKNLTSVAETNQVFAKLKHTVSPQFVDWCPTGFRCGQSPAPPSYYLSEESGDEIMAQSERSACMLANQSAVSQMYERQTRKFDIMQKKRAFLHHYLANGMEES